MVIESLGIWIGIALLGGFVDRLYYNHAWRQAEQQLKQFIQRLRESRSERSIGMNRWYREHHAT